MSLPEITYYINLEHRVDRKNHIEKELYKVGITNYIRLNAVYNTEGWKGCTQSHIQVLEKFMESGLNNCLVLEDDFYFVDHEYSKNILQKFSQEDIEWDIVLLTCNCKKTKISNIDYLVKPDKPAQTTAGYIVNKNFAKILCDNFKRSVEKNKALDTYWKILQDNDKYKWYIFEPRLGKQLNGYSDIQNKEVDYTNVL